METEMNLWTFLGQLSLALPVAMGAAGSALGAGAAGMAAAGAWGKAAKAGKALSMLYVALVGAPLSQTIYGFLFMFVGLKTLAAGPLAAPQAGLLLSLAFACGTAQLVSAWVQGRIAAAACRAMSEGDNKGFTNMLILLGIAETVGIFGLLFPLLIAMGLK